METYVHADQTMWSIHLSQYTHGILFTELFE